MAVTAFGTLSDIDTLHAQALAVYSLYLSRQGNFVEAIRNAEQSLQMARALSDKKTEAFSLMFHGVAVLVQGSVAESTPLLEQSLALYRVLGDKIGQAATMEALSINSVNLERSAAFARESLKLYRELGHLSGIATCLTRLARLILWSGDFSSPVPWLNEALSLSHQLGDQTSEEEALVLSGTLAYWQGDYQRAEATCEEASQLSEKIGDHYQNLWGHIWSAYAILRQGDIRQARALFEDSLRRALQADVTITVVFALEGLASLMVRQEQHDRAARLFAWTDAMRDEIGNHRPPIEQASVERDLAIVHSQLDDAAFEQAHHTGRSMSMEQAVAHALEEKA